MKAVDSSVVMVAFNEGHASSDAAVAIINGDCVLPAHAAIESYSVLTRSPEPLRMPPAAVVDMLRSAFDDRIVQLGKREILPFLDRMAQAGLPGGAVYDALIAETARRNGATLVTRDRRAAATYAAVGVEVEYLA